MTAKTRIAIEGPEDVVRILQLCVEDTKNAHREAQLAVAGQRVRITRDWRDQPYGRSLPNLKGKEFAVRGATLDPDGVHLWLDDLRCAVPMEYVEILP